MKFSLFRCLLISAIITGCGIKGRDSSFELNWNSGPPLPGSAGQGAQIGMAGMAGGVSENVLLLSGGANFPEGYPWQGGKKKFYNSIFVLTKEKGGSYSWSNQVFNLPNDLAYAASAVIDSGVVLAGGENSGGPLSDVLLLTWLPEQQSMHIRSLPSLPIRLTNASAVWIENKIYVVGGETNDSTLSSVFVFDRITNPDRWVRAAPLPKPASHAVTIVQSNGKSTGIYVFGGRNKTASGISEIHSAIFFYSPSENSWQHIGDVTDSSGKRKLAAGCGVAIGPANVLLLGGDEGRIFGKLEALNKSILDAVSENEKTRLSKTRDSIQITHPGFNKTVSMYNTTSHSWTDLNAMPYGIVTTQAFLWENDIIIPSGETSPGIRTPLLQIGRFVKEPGHSISSIGLLPACNSTHMKNENF